MKRFIGLIFCCVAMFLFGGCGDGGGRVGPTRAADTIHAGTDGVRTAWFAYVTATGDLLKQEGLRMEFTDTRQAVYFTNNGLGGLTPHGVSGVQSITASGVTGTGGRMVATGHRSDWTCLPGYVLFSDAVASKPALAGGGAQAKFYYRTRAVYNPSEYALVEASGTVASCPMEGGDLTASEWAALSGPTEAAPVSGADLDALTLLNRQGNRGEGIVQEMTYFAAVNLTEPNDYFRYASPLCYSAIVKTAAPLDLCGMTFGGHLTSTACPEGINVDLFVLGSSEDMQSHVVRSDWILPIDSRLPFAAGQTVEVYDRWSPFDSEPNLWDEQQYVRRLKPEWYIFADPNYIGDPNTLTDPNLFEFIHRLDTRYPRFIEEGIFLPDRIDRIPMIPVLESGDWLQMTIRKNDVRMLSYLSDYWLTGNPVMDLNRDGIVNLKDSLCGLP